VNQINAAADASANVLRLSMDAKAGVKVGPFAQGGKSRSETKGCDHDFTPDATVTPVGIFLPASDELFVHDILSKVTSDCLLDLSGTLVVVCPRPLCPYHHPGDQSG